MKLIHKRGLKEVSEALVMKVEDKKLLHAAYSQEANAPQDEDEVMAAYFTAADEDLLRDGPHSQMVAEGLALRREMGRQTKPLAMVNLDFRNSHHNMLFVEPAYPSEEDKDPRTWRRRFRNAAQDPIVRERWISNFGYNTIQSNVPDRYKAHKALICAELGELASGAVMLDVGCSALLGTRKLATGLPFSEVRNVYTDSGLAPDAQLARKFNAILSTPYFLEEYVGLDVMPIKKPTDETYYDEALFDWIYACSFRPNELKDVRRVEEWKKLARARIEGEHFVWGSFTKETMKNSPVKKFDVASFTTMMYLLDDGERTRMLELVDDYLKPHGFAIVQDFAYKRAGDPSKLEIFEKWEPWTYRTYIKYKGDSTLHEVFRWNNGRSKDMTLGRDIARTALGRLLIV